MKIGSIRRIEVEGGGYASEPAVARGGEGGPWMAWMRRTDQGREEVWVGRADLADLDGAGAGFVVLHAPSDHHFSITRCR